MAGGVRGERPTRIATTLIKYAESVFDTAAPETYIKRPINVCIYIISDLILEKLPTELHFKNENP
jgi:hypothetical protein